MAEFKVNINENIFDVDFHSKDEIIINGEKSDINIELVRENVYSVLLNNKIFEINLKQEKNGEYFGEINNQTFEIEIEDEQEQLLHSLEKSVDLGSKKTIIKAPMPGLILKIEVKVGERVEPGRGLLILEAMKMENEIKSLVSGEIREILVKDKFPVEKGQSLMVIE